MKARLRFWAIVFGCSTAIGLLMFAYHYLEFVANGIPVSPFGPFINELLTGAWMAGLLFPFVLWFARRFPINRKTWKSALPLHAAVVIAYSLAHTSLQWAMRGWLYPAFGFAPYNYGWMPVRYPMEFFHDVIIYTVAVGGIYLFDRQLRTAQLETKLAESRLENLRLQIQPHFLFNALNTISSLVYEDPRRADEAIAKLSALLRRTIEDTDGPFVPLDREIETLELYVNIMRSRFEDKLGFDLHVAPEAGGALVPHLLLQPIVENCIRHGATPHSQSVKIQLSADVGEGNTRLCIRDFGRGLTGGKLNPGTGLSNTAARLKQLYGNDHELQFQNCEGGGLAVTLAIPFRT